MISTLSVSTSDPRPDPRLHQHRQVQVLCRTWATGLFSMVWNWTLTLTEFGWTGRLTAQLWYLNLLAKTTRRLTHLAMKYIYKSAAMSGLSLSYSTQIAFSLTVHVL